MKTFVLLLITGLIVAPHAAAHEGHVHEAALEAAPRGGILRDAPPYKTEAVLNGDTVRVYIYDKTLAPITPQKPQAKADVTFPRQKAKPVIFLKKDGFYEATIKGLSKVHRYDLHITLEIDKIKVVADFGIDNIQ